MRGARAVTSVSHASWVVCSPRRSVRPVGRWTPATCHRCRSSRPTAGDVHSRIATGSSSTTGPGCRHTGWRFFHWPLRPLPLPLPLSPFFGGLSTVSSRLEALALGRLPLPPLPATFVGGVSTASNDVRHNLGGDLAENFAHPHAQRYLPRRRPPVVVDLLKGVWASACCASYHST